MKPSTMTSSHSSPTFVPNVPVTRRPVVLGTTTSLSTCALIPARGHADIGQKPASPATTTSYSAITMRKGRYQGPGTPGPQQRMQRQQQQQVPLPEDGTPVFALFVRTPRQKIWYPLGAVKGDDRSKGLVDALKGSFLKGMYQQALDKGIAQTVYGKDSARYLQTAVKMYPQLKKYSNILEFGYRVQAVDLDEQPTKLVTKDMTMGVFRSMQKGLGDWVKGLQGGGD